MGKSEELQRQTQRVLTELSGTGKPLSARAAGEKLNLGYNQIADMVKGKAPAEKTLINFACAIGEDPSAWLRYAGKYDFARSLERPETVKITEEQRMAGQIAKELAALTPERRALVLRQIRALIRATVEDEHNE